MKKIITVMLTIIMASTLIACENSGNQTNEPSTVIKVDKFSEGLAEQKPDSKKDNSNVLIAYFTWADNTEVKEPAAVDVDASTSASVLPPGNVARMAEWICQETGGDMFSIRVKDQYSEDYDKCLDRAADEKAENARPELAESVNNMDQYDTIFLGYPNWWYSVPMPVLTFINQHDLAGKKIVLFCSHGTGGLASSVEDIRAELPSDCEVEEKVIGIYRDDIADGQQEVTRWLKEIGY